MTPRRIILPEWAQRLYLRAKGWTPDPVFTGIWTRKGDPRGLTQPSAYAVARGWVQ